MPWRSKLWAGLEPDFGSDQETLNPQAEAWIERIVQEPWLAALLRLVAKDAWVGTEEQLLDELKAFAGDRVYQPSDFPRTLDELHTYIASDRRVFGQLDLDVLDYREVSGDSLKYWREEVTYLPGASRWSLKSPILVCQRSRVPVGEYTTGHWEECSSTGILSPSACCSSPRATIISVLQAGGWAPASCWSTSCVGTTRPSRMCPTISWTLLARRE
jgi:hypothetical protein